MKNILSQYYQQSNVSSDGNNYEEGSILPDSIGFYDIAYLLAIPNDIFQQHILQYLTLNEIVYNLTNNQSIDESSKSC